MVGTKKKNVYRKKRKGKLFSGVPKQVKKAKERSEIVDQTPRTSHPLSDSDEVLSASRKKMKPTTSSSDSSGESCDEEKVFQGQGYRLIDLKKFSLTLSEAHVCEEGEKFLFF